MSSTFANDLRELDAAEIDAVGGGRADVAVFVLVGGILVLGAMAAYAYASSTRSGSGPNSPPHPAEKV